MIDFRAAKPDIRILLLQTVLSVVLMSLFHTIYTLLALFGVLSLLVFAFCGHRTFFKNIGTYAVLNVLFYGLTAINIPILSGLLPPFLFMLIRVYPAWLALTILNAKARMDEMLYVFDLIHIPKSFSIPLMVVYRYVPTLLRELRYINDSLRMRELNTPAHPWRTLTNHIVPLLSRSEKISEELSAASLCKGLSTDRKRTSCTDVHISRSDLIYLTIMICVFVCLIIFDLYLKGGILK